MWRVVVMAAVGLCARPATRAPAPPPVAIAATPTILQPGASAAIADGVVAEDGTAAVTIDEFRGMRLWPTLDGTREPLVLLGPPARELALAHDAARTFGVAIVDDARTLTIATVDARDELHARQVGTVAGVTATGDAIVAWLDDATVELFDVRGVLTGRVVVPGHLVTVTARGHHVLAIVDGRHGTIGYPIEHGVLGAATPALPIEPRRVALSPDGKRLAGMQRRAALVVELATGAIARHWKTHRRPDDDSDDDDDDDNRCLPLGFVDHDVVACANDNVVFWMKPDGSLDRYVVGNARRLVLGAADGIVLAARSSALELMARDAPSSFLGYRIAGPGKVHASPRGVAIGTAEGWRLLDDHLAVAKTLPGASSDMVPLARDTLWIDTDRSSGFIQLRSGSGALVDRVVGADIVYEPATQLAAVARETGVSFVHVDTGSSEAFGNTIGDVRTFLLDPKLANGEVAVLDDAGSIYTLRAVDLSARTAKPTLIDLDLAAVDRAGRFYDVDGSGLRVGARVFANTVGAKLVAPDPIGARVVVAGDRWLALYDAHGAQQWRITFDEGPHPIWNGDRLFVAMTTGLVELAPATGATVRARCGWEFGKLADPPPPTEPIESPCSR